MSDTIKKQIGGQHYMNMGIQPWEIIDANGLDFYEGTALSYLLRWKHKGGVQDLEKAIHTIERRIAIERDDEKIGNKEAGCAMVKTCQDKGRGKM